MEEKKKDNQDFIVETPIIIEEKVGKNGEKVRKYERGKFLGKGGFAKCYEMKSSDTKKIFAAKLFEKKALTDERSRKKLINEIKLHKRLHHQNIVNFEHFFEDKDNVYILLELCANQTLNELLKRRKRLTEIEVQYYMVQIIQALKYIHSHKIIHRDLKLGNCFINSSLELKLGDFGLAAKLEYDGQRRKTVCGTPNYIAPEILEKKGHSYEVDIWSLGVLAYTLLFGKPPFETTEVKQTYKRIKSNTFSYPENINVHPSAKKMLSNILVLDPMRRLSLDGILNCEFLKLYSNLPLNMPISTLACPPNKEFIDQYKRKSAIFTTTINSDRGTKSHPFHEKYNSALFETDQINNFMNSNNLNTIDNIDINELLKSNTNILSHLIESSSSNNYHRKSESCNNFSSNDKQSMNVIKTNINNSRNINKNDILVTNNEIVTSYKNDTNRLTNYIDYTPKFGYIYFSAYHIGIFFNDNTNIVKIFNKHDKNYLQVSYFDKSGKNKLNLNESGIDMFLKNKNNSKDLVKKIEIMKHILSKYSNQEYKADANKNFFLIKKVIKTDNCVLFRLNNKTIQSFFNDKTEVVLSTESNDCVYKDKGCEEKVDTIFNIINSNNTEMIQKIKFIKNLLIKYIKDEKKK